jgi:class 3 adenylate cyclase/tetratricopeptide (TPR) repeat protein
MNCRSCGAGNSAERKFCLECGTALARMCSGCGSPNEPDAKFCGQCGEALVPDVPAGVLRPPPTAERRVVSVLFADLVGFTDLSASRDAEEVRELLTRYFDSARRLVERYGGSVEKFIGDAVMAVWGAPVANEDDAERAVRTALDMIAAVSALADELALPDLRLRVGVLTGEAAVTVGAEGQGMVAGDLVNTAARIQSAAEPGAVLVGDATRRASEASIAYEDAGDHELKGKNERVRLHRALRVIAARRGEGRSLGLEPPFVGRDREFRLVKELFHSCAQERHARLVSVVGIAGMGKTRLSWEFEKHVDGLAFDVRWHRGRCLAYGEGVAFWALAEMVRMRARIAEEDAPETAVAKLGELLAGFVPDPDERAFLELRLRHLLGLADRNAPDKEDLFSAWRLFFERIADREPVVLVFEDIQWADAALLDFIEYLLDWSRAFPIYVLTLGRPQPNARRTDIGDYTVLSLDALGDGEIDELLRGLAPGLPDELRGRIVERAEGVPLYAVETVRMLLDRGLLERAGEEYRPTGPIEALDVPETLQALAAARLDGLEPVERRVVEDASVLGKTFTRQGLAVLSGLHDDELGPLVQALLRKEILTVQSDPLSPARGQLSFVQDLLRRVAYDTLSLRERKTRHLAAAAHLSSGRESEEELAAVLAAHYVDAYRAGTGDPDAGVLKVQAREFLTRAGERAISLAAAGEAARYFVQAAELADEPGERADLLSRSGRAAAQAGDTDEAFVAFDQAIALLRASGDISGAARVEARRADLQRFQGRIEEARASMQSAYEALLDGEHDADLALVASMLARVSWFAGMPEAAVEPVELALDIAEALGLPEALAEALNTKGMMLYRRQHESEALLRESLKVALDHDLTEAVLRAQFNLSGLAIEHDRPQEARRFLEDSLALARRRGDRGAETYILGQLAEVLVGLGEWDGALAALGEAPGHGQSPFAALNSLLARLPVAIGRGELRDARTIFDDLVGLQGSSDQQDIATYLLCEAILCRAEGKLREAITSAQAARELWQRLSQFHYATRALVEEAEALLELDELHGVEGLLAEAEQVPVLYRRPLLGAQQTRLRAKLQARRGDPSGAEGYTRATLAFRELGLPFWHAITLLEYGEWLIESGDADGAEAALSEAGTIFERLDAQPWIERAAQSVAHTRLDRSPSST